MSMSEALHLAFREQDHHVFAQSHSSTLCRVNFACHAGGSSSRSDEAGP